MDNPSRNIESIHGLSPMQEGILFHTIHAPGSGLYIEQYSCRLDGPVDGEILQRAWHEVVHRHPALRSFFPWERRAKPLQIVRERVSVPWQEEDWRTASAGQQTERLDAYLREDRSRGFELESAPLLRLALFRVAEQTFRFVFTFQHLLLDGWSLRLVLLEVWKRYQSLRTHDGAVLPPVPPYREYLSWLERQDLTGAEAFWRNELTDFDTPTGFGAWDHGRAARWAEGSDAVELRMSEAESSALVGWARTHRLTLSTVLRGAWAFLLSRYNGVADVVFGATVSGRPPDLDGVENMVGLFINTIPVRARLSDSERVVPWLQRLGRQQMEASAHEFAPLVRIQRWSEVRGTPLLQSVLVIQNVPSANDASAGAETGLGVSEERYLEQSNFPLALLAFPSSELLVRFVYDRERFSAEAIHRIAEHFRTILSEFQRSADLGLGDLSLMSAPERHRMLVEWNNQRSDPPPDLRIHQWIARVAAEHPDRPAVEFADRTGIARAAAANDPGRGTVERAGPTLTYRELLARAGRLAQRLHAHGVAPGDRVVLALDRSVEMITGILGILEAGAAYVPLDPSQPDERIRFVLGDTGSPLILTTDAYRGRLAGFGLPVLCLDREIADAATELALASGRGTSPTSGRTRPPKPDDLAYVIYTSGSTGAPKGVEITHRNLVHSTWSRHQHYAAPVQCFCLTSPFVFDSSVAGIFWTLTQGGLLLLPEPRAEQEVGSLESLIAARKASHLLTLPSLYALVLEHAQPGSLDSLSTVIVAGESCARPVVQAHFQKLPGATLHNEYGPTEATVWSTVFDLRPETPDPIPIGKPNAHTCAYVLDERLRPAPIGVAGELFLAGAGLARGYLNRPELTAERFLEHPIEGVGPTRLYRTGDRARFLPDGNLEFLGRVDHQVKIRGHRIELGEIESVLEQHPSVRTAVAMLSPLTSPGNPVSLFASLQEIDEERAQRLLEEVEALSEDATEDLLSHDL